MASDTSPVALNFDIWYLVFDFLRDQCGTNPFFPNIGGERSWLRSTRLVSHSFNMIATKHAYEYMDISSESLMERILDAASRYDQPYYHFTLFLENIRQHTKFMCVTTAPQRYSIWFTVELLETSRSLQHLTWMYRNGENDGIHNLDSEYLIGFLRCQYPPSSYSYESSYRLGWLHRKEQKTKDWGSLPKTDTDDDREGKPQNEVVQAAGTNKCSHLSRNSANLPVRAIATLCLSQSLLTPPIWSALIPIDRMCPPMLKLKLLDYTWNTSKNESLFMWDFSMIKFLSFKNSDVSIFVQAVPVERFVRLRSLKIVKDCLSRNDRLAEFIPALILKTLVDHLLQLCPDTESLKVEYFPSWSDAVSFSEVAKLGRKLRKLRLRSMKRALQIPNGDLAWELPRFAKLSHLGLDIEAGSDELPGFLSTIAQSKSLQYLDFWANHSLRTSTVPATSTDPDFDGAERIMRSLHSQKFGAPFISITIRLVEAIRPPNWRPPRHDVLNFLPPWSRLNDPRVFSSRIDSAGTYVQSGSPRVGDLVDETISDITAVPGA
ncbi:uncharacterized protein RAG0_00743 [Rhynchosporium agropyri]|uniref:Uncharacterized protein n=1 Tax=Rhynchosporium agropyri TaxID=914238 RepID=A0A1E1JUI8_9HELO|nr:uncharacterized protein RAG0_00743 [Rhynchosporium agropyri]